MNTYKVTLPTGGAAYRSSAKHTYTHALIVRDTIDGKNHGWHVARWSGWYGHAANAKRSLERRYNKDPRFAGTEFQIVEVATC